MTQVIKCDNPLCPSLFAGNKSEAMTNGWTNHIELDFCSIDCEKSYHELYPVKDNG